MIMIIMIIHAVDNGQYILGNFTLFHFSMGSILYATD